VEQITFFCFLVEELHNVAFRVLRVDRVSLIRLFRFLVHFVLSPSNLNINDVVGCRYSRLFFPWLVCLNVCLRIVLVEHLSNNREHIFFIEVMINVISETSIKSFCSLQISMEYLEHDVECL